MCIKSKKKTYSYYKLIMSIFRLHLNLPVEYIPMINDIARVGIIQIVAQIMFYIANPIENPFWSVLFLQTIFFLLIGVLSYWLVIRKIVTFEPSSAVSLASEISQETSNYVSNKYNNEEQTTENSNDT